MTKTNIHRSSSSIFFSTFTDDDLYNVPECWRPPIYDYAEVKPDRLYLVYPNGTVLTHLTEMAVRCGVLTLPDCKTDFTEDSPCVKALVCHGKYRVCIHKQYCYVYTPAKFKKLLVQAGRKSLGKQLAYIKSKLAEIRKEKKLTETLTEQFSRGL